MIQRLGLLTRFRKDERGVFLVIFAILAVVLIATSGAVVDFTRVQQARTRAQTALDGAALALQGTINNNGVTAITLRDQAQKLLTERIGDSSITAVVQTATPNTTEGKLTLTAYISVPTYFVQMVGIPSIRASMLSEVTRASSDIEVAIAADLTYSMLGTKLTALQDAMKSTIDLLVQTQQTPTYSKMAIAPYSNGVNAGVYANNARGAIVGGRTISNVTGTVGSLQTIASISKATQAIVTTSANHGLAANDFVYIGNVTGMTQITAGIYKVGSSPGAKDFKLLKADGTAINSSSYTNYTANSGRSIECLNSTCKIIVTTSATHDFANGDFVYITGAGASYFNDAAWEVSERTNTNFVPKGVTPLNSGLTGNGGTSYCTKYGCSYYRFTNASSGINIFVPTDCVVERTTTPNGFLDTSPTTAPVGIQYAPANGLYPGSPELEACPKAAIQPLTSDKTKLQNLVKSFVAQGSTAGHIGLAWAWYMLSPTFLTGNIGTQWPTDAKPGPYRKSNLVKAIILMTDGDFNTMYASGAPAKNAGIINNATKSNTNSPLGTSAEQGAALCTEIKKSAYNILIYTVGFQISKGSAADTLLKNCATDATKYKTASDAATLKKAFEAIANSLSELRVSK